MAGEALDAGALAGWVGFAVGKRMTGRVHHVIERDGADIGAEAVAHADIPVHCRVASMDTQLGRGLDGSPNFVSTVFTYNFAFSLKIRVNRQKQSPLKLRRSRHISVSAKDFGERAFYTLKAMAQYSLPKGMRYATLEERREFYFEEFSTEKVAEWFGYSTDKIRFAVIVGRHTKIFPEKYRRDASTTIIIDDYRNLADVQTQVLDFLPEAVYYDRNIYNNQNVAVGQELAFDLDPENITCPIHGALEDKMKRQQGISFCEIELNMVKQEAIALHGYLERRFKKLKVVYSGRGFHLHVLDTKAYCLSVEERLAIAKEIKGAGFHIDEWVTSGEYHLIRLPYSLNGLVSRIAFPLRKEELKSFDALKDKRCLPKFLARATF